MRAKGWGKISQCFKSDAYFLTRKIYLQSVSMIKWMLMLIIYKMT